MTTGRARTLSTGTRPWTSASHAASPGANAPSLAGASTLSPRPCAISARHLFHLPDSKFSSTTKPSRSIDLYDHPARCGTPLSAPSPCPTLAAPLPRPPRAKTLSLSARWMFLAPHLGPAICEPGPLKLRTGNTPFRGTVGGYHGQQSDPWPFDLSEGGTLADQPQHQLRIYHPGP